MTFLRTASLVALLTTAAACTGGEEIDFSDTAAKVVPEPSDGSQSGDAPSAMPASTIASLEIRALDIWGRPLSAQDAKLTVLAGGKALDGVSVPSVELALGAASDLEVQLEAEQFHPLHLTVRFDGTNGAHGVNLTGLDGSAGHGVVLAHDVSTTENSLTKHVLYLGLRHKWFSAQARPPRGGNDIQLYRSGEQSWQAVRTALDAAVKTVFMSSWWWESDFELTRDAATTVDLTAAERWKNTIMGVLEHSKAQKRVLVTQFVNENGSVASINTDSYIRDHGKLAGDNFEFMQQLNPSHGKFMFQPTAVDFAARVKASEPGAAKLAFDASQPIASNLEPRAIDLTQWPVKVDIDAASYHQKFAVIDDGLTFVGGMNVQHNDWDTTAHKVFEPRRMRFSDSKSDRLEVVNKQEKSKDPPRKDYMMRIAGPAAQDVADVAHKRWQLQLDHKAAYSENATPFAVNRNIADKGAMTVQITTTMPEPFYENGIAESWYNAVDNAEHYIYIEDQYFRAPMLNERIKARMLARPNLVLVVVSIPVGEWTDPGCAWTYQSHQLFATQFPGRYLTLQLRSFDTSVKKGFFVIDETKGVFADFYIHAKLLLVDDVFMSVGSANKNNRGMVYEGEMNVAIVDPVYVRAQRRASLAENLPLGATISDDAKSWFYALGDAAKANDAVYAAWKKEGGDIDLDGAPMPAKYLPHGFLYTLPFGTLKDCLMESVGPDMTEGSEAAPQD